MEIRFWGCFFSGVAIIFSRLSLLYYICTYYIKYFILPHSKYFYLPNSIIFIHWKFISIPDTVYNFIDEFYEALNLDEIV